MNVFQIAQPWRRGDFKCKRGLTEGQMIKRRNARGNGLPDKDRRKGEIYGSGGRNFQRENMAVFHFSPSDQRDSETLQNMTGSCISRTPENTLPAS